MKKQLFLLASVAVAMFSASCQREVIPTTPEEVQAAELHLTVQSVAPMSRTAVAADGDESKINHGTGFVFRGTDNAAVLDAAPFAISTSGQVTSTKVTTAAKAVFLVTNTKNVDFTNVRTLADLKALTSDLFDNETATQDKANLVMWGQAEVVVGTPYTATVTLRFAPAKVAFNYTLAEGQNDLTNPEVVVLNAQGTSRLFPAGAFAASKAADYVSLMPGTPSYYAAIDMTGFGVTNATVKSALLIDNAAANVAHTFYLFENANEEQSTIIALRGTYQGATYYYPVHFSNKDKGTAAQFESILAGKSYEVAAKINHLSGGVTDPTNPVTQSSMEVTVVPAQWFTNVSWVKEFN